MELKCDTCEKNFGSAKNLRRHQKTHNKDRSKYVCEFCGKSYFRSEHLKRHLISHSDDKKPFKCEHCITRFSNKSHLNRHIKFAHLSNTINCSHCDERFSKKGDLYRHLYIHTKVKPFACYFPYCKRSYFKQGKLQSHINSHHIQKNYITSNQLDKELELSKSNNISCETMEQSVTGTEDLFHQNFSCDSNNSQSKSRERTFFKCPFKVCKNYYTRKSNLKVHLRVKHIKSRDFKCIDCGASFAHKRSLKLHGCVRKCLEPITLASLIQESIIY